MQMKGVLLVNLGSPDSTNTNDVRNYLEEFLMDERVIDLPKWFRSFLVKGIILKTRPTISKPKMDSESQAACDCLKFVSFRQRAEPTKT